MSGVRELEALIGELRAYQARARFGPMIIRYRALRETAEAWVAAASQGKVSPADLDYACRMCLACLANINLGVTR